MPLIMDQDLDELFGKDPTLGLPDRPAPVTDALAKLLETRRETGCYQNIAWSKLGFIAHISANGTKIHIRQLQCTKKDRKWVLGPEYPIESVNVHADQPIVHLSWSLSGVDLVAIDTCGRTWILSTNAILNTLKVYREPSQDREDDLSHIVGTFWLNQSRESVAYRHAERENGIWKYATSMQKTMGPFHPSNRSTFLSVSSSGRLRILWQLPDGRWSQKDTELRSVSNLDLTITHATFASTTDGTISLAVYTKEGQLIVYSVMLKMDGSSSFPTVAIETKPMAVSWPKSTFQRMPGLYPLQGNDYANHVLTHLEFIPPYGTVGVDAMNNATRSSPPVLVAVFQTMAHPSDEVTQQMEPASVIVRWQVEPYELSLHTAFEEIKPGQVQTPKFLILRKLDDVQFAKNIVSLHYLEILEALSVLFDDGTFSLHDPSTMRASYDGQHNSVTSLAQAGFHFPIIAPAYHVAYSPNNCSAVVMDSEMKARLVSLETNFLAETGLVDDGKFWASIAALVLATANASGLNLILDDVLLIVKNTLAQDSQRFFMRDLYRALLIEYEAVVVEKAMVRNTALMKSLSNLAALAPNTYPPNVCKTLQSIRSSAVLYTMFYNKNSPASQETVDLDREVKIIQSTADWTIRFFWWLVNDLFEVHDKLKASPDPSQLLQTLVASEEHSFSLTMLSSSICRNFLKFASKSLRGILVWFRGNAGRIKGGSSSSAHQSFLKIHTQFTQSTLSMSDVMELLESFETEVQRILPPDPSSDNIELRRDAELEMTMTCQVHPLILPVTYEIVTKTLPQIFAPTPPTSSSTTEGKNGTTLTTQIPSLDRAKLHFENYIPLALDNTSQSHRFFKSHCIDIMRKTTIPIPPSSLATKTSSSPLPSLAGLKGPEGQQMKRCVRCGEMTEELKLGSNAKGDGGSGSPAWLIMCFKNCLCGGAWEMCWE